MLLHLIVAHGAFQLHLNERHVVVAPTVDCIYIAHGAYALLKRVGHFHLHLMGGCTGISGDDHRQLYLNFGVLKLAHGVAGVDSTHHKNGNQEVDQLLVAKSPFAKVNHNIPPTFV